MITGILGSDEMGPPRSAMVQKASACGNGKGITLNYIGWSEYLRGENEGNPRKIITNYHTRFPGGEFSQPSWSEYRTNQQIFDNWWKEENKGALILITELQSIFNSCNRNNKIIAYIEKCLVQRRKMNYEIVYDSQELGSVDKRFRNMTNFIWLPMKFHAAYDPHFQEYVPVEPCPMDTCDQAHIILVYQNYPYPSTIEEMTEPLLRLKAWEVGQLYDTNEQMIDSLQYNPAWEKMGV